MKWRSKLLYRGSLMSNLIDRLRAAHRFLGGQSFYPLALSGAMACAILAVRMRLSHSPGYIFMVWNLFLAWVPYVWSLAAASSRRNAPTAWWRLILPGALWLLFFPNAAYLVTDFIHLRPRELIPLWFDVGMLAVFAWNGCFLAVASLRAMQTPGAGYLGRAASGPLVPTATRTAR